jgi:hypothetical protein
VGHSRQEIDLDAADHALAALAENPELLERARARFEPQYYYSLPPGTPTDPACSPDRLSPASELQQENNASLPQNQFNAQVDKEMQRLGDAGHGLSHEVRLGPQKARRHAAQESVKARWLEQGIWRKEWGGQGRLLGPWKHEVPDGDWNMPSNPLETQTQGPESDEAACREEHEREASRPYHQFIYHVSKERERILDGMRHPDQDPAAPGDVAPISAPSDISTTAYKRVKAAWVHHTIWDAKWGVLPGNLWKHELSFSELVRSVTDDDPALASPEPIDNMHILANAISRPNLVGSPGSPSGSDPDVEEEPAKFDVEEEPAEFDVKEGLEEDLAELDAVLLALSPHRAAASSTGAGTPNPAATRHEQSVALGPVHASRVTKHHPTASPARLWRKRAVPAVPISAPRPNVLRRSKRLQVLRDGKTAAGHGGLRGM